MATKANTTAIRAVTGDIGNHTIVLQQLKEVVEVAQRQRGDPGDSFVRVSELSDAGVLRFDKTSGVKAAQGAGASVSWATPSLLNGWSNAGGSYNEAGYYSGSDGRVWLRGVLTGGTAVAGTPLFNLPPDFRPVATNIMAAPSDGGYGEIRITPGGDVTINAGSSASISLDGLSFSTV